MSSNVVKLKPETYERVKRKASEQGATMQEIVARGIDALDRLEFARAFRDDYEALREDTGSWDREERERSLWESTVDDGISL